MASQHDEKDLIFFLLMKAHQNFQIQTPTEERGLDLHPKKPKEKNPKHSQESHSQKNQNR